MSAAPSLFRCPTCRSALAPATPSPDDVDRLACTGCGREWPVRFGIPDLRDEEVSDPYLTKDEDLRAATRLFERAQTGGFADVLASYYETNDRVSTAQARRFIAGALAAEERARATLATWREWSAPGRGDDGGTVLELGCGTGPMLVASFAPNVKLLGIDVGLRGLVLAAARLRERDIPAALACAGADRLPLANGSVDVVVAESLLENVPSAGNVVREAARVVRPAGWLRLTTPNRWSVGPDPHVGLPLGGWLPDGIVRAWALRRGMVPPRRHLLGAEDLRRLLSAPLFGNVRLGPAPVSDAQRNGASPVIRAAVDAYRVIAQSSLGRAALVAIGPSLLAIAQRTASTQEAPPSVA